MKKISKTIVFFGNERLATGVSTTAPTLGRLIDEGYTIAAVIANYERGVSRNARQLEIAEVAKLHNIPLLLPSKPVDILDSISSFQADAGILVAYGRIVPQSIIGLFPRGIINIHPSLLPEHRGPIPIESIMLSGQETTGVSLMQLAKAMDSGPVYAQNRVTLSGTESKQELADKLLEVGGTMLIQHLPAILAGTLVPTAQDDSTATYDALITRDAGVIDWHKPVTQLMREIKAYASWPGSKTCFGNLAVSIMSAHAAEGQGVPGSAVIIDKQPAVFCKDGLLILDTVKPAGKKEMPGKAFLAGYKNIFLSD